MAAFWIISTSPVYADEISDIFRLTMVTAKGVTQVETLQLMEAKESTKFVAFSTTFPLGTGFLVDSKVVTEVRLPDDSDIMRFVKITPTNGQPFLQLQVKSDTDAIGMDAGEFKAFSIVGADGKPSTVADTLFVRSDPAAPAVPEPGTIALLTAGLVGLGFWVKARG